MVNIPLLSLVRTYELFTNPVNIERLYIYNIDKKIKLELLTIQIKHEFL